MLTIGAETISCNVRLEPAPELTKISPAPGEHFGPAWFPTQREFTELQDCANWFGGPLQLEVESSLQYVI